MANDVARAYAPGTSSVLWSFAKKPFGLEDEGHVWRTFCVNVRHPVRSWSRVCARSASRRVEQVVDVRTGKLVEVFQYPGDTVFFLLLNSMCD